jgi:prolyl oligopeptidase
MNAKPVQKTIGGVTFEDRFPHLHENTPEALEWQWARDAKAQAAAEASPNYEPVRQSLLSRAGGAGHAAPRKLGGCGSDTPPSTATTCCGSARRRPARAG